MDKRMKRLGFITFLILTVFCSQSTWAVLSSSYYDGRVYYNDPDEGLAGWIDFAVYDTEHAQFGSEYQDNGIEMPGVGQYIYAYQIFHHVSSESDVTEFSVLDMGGNLLGESLINGTSAQDDEDGGIAPSPIISDTQGVWTWSFEDGRGYISASEHSYLLVFSSEQNLTKGTYEIKGSGIPVPVPEPTTIAILGLGTVMLTARHRRRSRV